MAAEAKAARVKHAQDVAQNAALLAQLNALRKGVSTSSGFEACRHPVSSSCDTAHRHAVLLLA